VLVMTGLAGLLAIALVTTALLDGDDPVATRDAPDGSTPATTAATSATVVVDPKKYVGQPVEEVQSALRKLGLDTRVEDRANPGDQSEGTVAALDSSGKVATGSVVVLAVWGAPPAAKDEPKKDDKDGAGKGPGPEKKKPGKHGGKGSGPDDNSGSGPDSNSGNGP
jgi:beta-lactam-binding protein with PASTA domain